MKLLFTTLALNQLFLIKQTNIHYKKCDVATHNQELYSLAQKT